MITLKDIKYNSKKDLMNFFNEVSIGSEKVWGILTLKAGKILIFRKIEKYKD